jgi:flagellar M-ring protein FliF
MNETVNKLFQQTRNFYKGLTPGRRLSLVVVLLATVAGFSALAFFISHDEKKTLIGGLPADETQSVVSLLRSKNIPCSISSENGAIQVPASRLDEARIELASAGLPQGGGIGYELFDKNEIGLTSFREQVNYRRALEGELARTIRSLVEVRAARVHLVIPQSSIFKEDQKEPSAAVVLNLRLGNSLNAKQIKGIRSLVASSVEGLKPERVTILDGAGGILAKSNGEDSLSSSDERIDYERAMAQSFERRIQDLLEPLVGQGKVVAQVTADVDFDRQVETSEQYNPDRTAIRSEQHNSETRTGDSTVAAGVAGARSNQPGGGPDTTAANGSRYQHTSEVINYEIEKTVVRAERPQGKLKRISVAVVVDGIYRKEGEGDAAKIVYQARSAEDIERFATLVKKAVGFDPKRGDQVEVSNVAFQTQEAPEPTPWAMIRDLDLGPLVRTIGLVVLGLIVLLVAVRPALRVLSMRSNEIILPSGRQTTVSELERQLVKDGHSPALLTAGAAQNDLQNVARQLAQENPQRVVQVLKGWLEEK